MAILLLIANIVAWILYDCHHARKDNCFIADQVKFLDTATINNKEYMLVMITTGFQDKVSYLELFEQDVNFDHCGRPDKKYISAVDINYGPEHGPDIQWPEKIEIKGKQLILHYTKDKSMYTPLVDIPVVWHQD